MGLEIPALPEEGFQSTAGVRTCPPLFFSSSPPSHFTARSVTSRDGRRLSFHHYQVLVVDAYHMALCTSNKKNKGKGGCIQKSYTPIYRYTSLGAAKKERGRKKHELEQKTSGCLLLCFRRHHA